MEEPVFLARRVDRENPTYFIGLERIENRPGSRPLHTLVIATRNSKGSRPWPGEIRPYMNCAPLPFRFQACRS